MIRPSLRQLSYLIAIDEEGSFIAAADACSVTQSTLSAGIKELETILKQQLVIRGRKAATLTPFGLETVQQARIVIASADVIVNKSKRLRAPLSGPLRLGIIPTIAPYMLPDILPRLAAQFPLLELQLFEDITDRLLDKLHKSQIDVILMAFPYKTPDMTQSILFDEAFLAASPKDAKNTASIDIKDLEADKLLLLEDGHCLTGHALSACDLKAPRKRKTFSATSLPTLIQMVHHGYGMTLLPEMACRKDTIPKGIHLTPFTGKTKPTRQVGLCWKQKDPRQGDFELLAKSML